MNLSDVHWSATVSSFGVFGFVQCLTVMLLWGKIIKRHLRKMHSFLLYMVILNSVCPVVCLSICWFVFLDAHICPAICCLSVCGFVFLDTHVCPAVCLSMCCRVCVFGCPSGCFSVLVRIHISPYCKNPEIFVKIS